MQGVFRKLYMSILAATLILLTSIATTFAWVGMLTSSSLGSFDINIKVEDLENEYYLKISDTDATNCDDYGESIRRIDIQKQIMDNMGIDYAHSGIVVNNSSAVDNYFAMNANLIPVTTDKNLSYFKEIGDIRVKDTNFYDTNKYYKFDLYLTVDTLLNVNAATEINANVFFKNIETALTGVECKGNFVNGNSFRNQTLPTEYSLLPTLPNSGLRINSAYSARLGLALYDPIAITDSYENKSPSEIIIYQKGTKYPTYDSNTNYYCFGGILPEEYNVALKEIEKLYKIDSDDLQLPADAVERIETDKFMTQDNYHIWQSPTTISGTKYLGIVNEVRTKMKISVYFWFEGWDADSISFVDKRNVSIGLSFATDTKNNS